MRQRVLALLTAVVSALALAIFLPAASASAATCASAWNASAVYTGGGTASYNGHNWLAKWWTQNERPGTADVWSDQGGCGGTTPPTDPPSSGGFVVSESQFNQMFPGRIPSTATAV